MNDQSSSQPSGFVHLPRRNSRRLLFVGVYISACVACVSLGWGVFVYLRWGVAPNQTLPVMEFAYPELKTSEALNADRIRGGETFDVLMLGGSVLQRSWGNVEAELRQRLEARLGTKFRLYNLAESAHTSRDSLIKYRYIRDIPFDVVVVYDGINDVRMNVCPPGAFKSDYSHCTWYRWLDSRLAAGTINVSGEMLRKLQDVVLIPHGAPDERDLQFGADIRSPAALLANENELLDLASEKGDPVLLLTNTVCIPERYSRAAFDAKSLGFAAPGPDQMTGLAIELWGLPEVVRQTIQKQNAALRQAAMGRSGVVLVDMDKEFDPTNADFIDMCHLSPEGSRKFVERLWKDLEPFVDAYEIASHKNSSHAAER